MFLKRNLSLFLSIIFLATVLTFIPKSSIISAEEKQLVYVIPVEQGIERGLERFLERAFSEAENAFADAIILEINTLGGSVDAAIGIGKLIQKEQIPVYAYIKGEAISAGSYISLNADKIYMEPNSHIGAAAVRTISGQQVDPKITSWWASHMIDAAKQNNKNEEIARGMVDPAVEIPGLSKKGQLITLDSDLALKYGIADGIVQSRKQLLNTIGLGSADTYEVGLTPAERLARFSTNPYVIPILLIIGLAGILIELFIPGFGIAGLIGISAFSLYFFGHYFAGFAGWEDIIFFIVGFILMVVELFVPGFGIFGALGVISLFAGIIFAAYETSYGLISLVIAVVVNSILFFILFKYFKHQGLWNRFILKDEQKKEGGYISHTKDKTIVGHKGRTLTKLRPSGVALIDNKRYDVVSEGVWIEANQEIEVIFVEGTRIIVREVKK
ncbi:hypothetical protein HK1_00152 [Tepidibacillus sp. HK-1]|nr:hypothetical protein HK1_00152 [Tepidibacillus sp. HK-1]